MRAGFWWSFPGLCTVYAWFMRFKPGFCGLCVVESADLLLIVMPLQLGMWCSMMDFSAKVIFSWVHKMPRSALNAKTKNTSRANGLESSLREYGDDWSKNKNFHWSDLTEWVLQGWEPNECRNDGTDRDFLKFVRVRKKGFHEQVLLIMRIFWDESWLLMKFSWFMHGLCMVYAV